MRYLKIRKQWWKAKNTSPEFWENALPIGESVTGITHQYRQSEIAQLVLSRVHADHIVLDAGCGPMIWGPLVAEKGAEYLPLDYSHRLLIRGLRIHQVLKNMAVTGNVKSLPFAPNSIDLYLSLGILEHFPEGMEYPIKECTRVLKSGGIAVISVPYLNWIRFFLLPVDLLKNKLRYSSLFRRLLGRNPPPKMNFYQYAFTLHEFKRIIVSAGLDIQAIRPHAWEYGLIRDYHWFRRLRKRHPETFNHIVDALKRMSHYSCAHVVMIIAKKN